MNIFKKISNKLAYWRYSFSSFVKRNLIKLNLIHRGNIAHFTADDARKMRDENNERVIKNKEKEFKKKYAEYLSKEENLNFLRDALDNIRKVSSSDNTWSMSGIHVYCRDYEEYSFVQKYFEEIGYVTEYRNSDTVHISW